MRHHLHRHGVGHGAVIKLPGERGLPPCPPSSARLGLYCTESSQAGQPRTPARSASLEARHGSDNDDLESGDDDIALTSLVALQRDQANHPLIDQLLSARCFEPPRHGHQKSEIRVLAVK
jgi:hypothetical protein